MLGHAMTVRSNTYSVRCSVSRRRLVDVDRDGVGTAEEEAVLERRLGDFPCGIHDRGAFGEGGDGVEGPPHVARGNLAPVLDAGEKIHSHNLALDHGAD